jgi:hypothetical protein
LSDTIVIKSPETAGTYQLVLVGVDKATNAMLTQYKRDGSLVSGLVRKGRLRVNPVFDRGFDQSVFPKDDEIGRVSFECSLKACGKTPAN